MVELFFENIISFLNSLQDFNSFQRKKVFIKLLENRLGPIPVQMEPLVVYFFFSNMIPLPVVPNPPYWTPACIFASNFYNAAVVFFLGCQVVKFSKKYVKPDSQLVSQPYFTQPSKLPKHAPSESSWCLL